MQTVVIFGPPGSGKGTQCKKLSESMGFLHLSTGDLLRSEIAAKTPLGLDAQAIMAKGELVPDHVVLGMIANKVKELEDKGVLLDGMPRTVAQAEELDRILEQTQRKVDGVFSLEVEEGELVRRLIERGKDSGRADDTDESIIRNRLVEYAAKTKAVASYYQQSGTNFFTVDGQKEIDQVAADLAAIIEAK